ncbi:MAG: 4-hydroxy-tetrahydrodipicolinate reductase, partial [Pseudomonadota bacterium]|nr:4-hydroxy-tetrahydrodipicolinate reductase [Pseudomonadota bacterium]
MKILINGCAGRMGLTLVRLIDADPALELHGGLEGPEHADMGADLGVLAGLPENGKPVRADALELISGADAVIDFSTPAATLE